MKTLSDGEVLDSLREVVAGKEDFIYKQDDHIGICTYVRQDSEGNRYPDCLIAHWLYNQGVDLEKLAQNEMKNVNQFVEDFLDVSDTAVRALQVAQRAQDSGETWGEALERAEGVFGA